MTIMTLQDRMVCAKISAHRLPILQALPFGVNPSRKHANKIRKHMLIEFSTDLPIEVLWPNSIQSVVETRLLVETNGPDPSGPVHHGSYCLVP
jgi:hypothetical protein